MNYFFNITLRYLSWKNIFFALLIFVFSVAMNILTANANNDNLLLFLNGVSGPGILALSIIFIVVLPASLSIYEDLEHRNIQNILTRMSIKKYFFSKIFSTGLVSSILIFILLTTLLLISLFYNKMPNNMVNNFTFGAFSSLYPHHKLLYSIIFILNGSAFSFVFSILAVTATIFWRNKYSAAIITFIMYTFTTPLFAIFGWGNLGFTHLFDYSSNYLTSPVLIYSELLGILALSIFLGYLKLKRLIYVYK
jgi:hypothetical protein